MTTPRQRILRATAGVLSWQPQGADGEPATVDPGTVTVGVTRSDGTDVLAAGTATAGTGTAARTVTLTAAQTTNLDRFTATWTASGNTLAVTVADIVGGFYFTVTDIRGREPSTADANRDTVLAIIDARTEIEDLIESVCGVAFVPRFEIARIPVGSATAVRLPWPRVRRIRWIRTWSGNTTSTPVDAVTVAAIPGSVTGVVGLGVTGDVEVGYEHGYDAPFSDVAREAILACRTQLNRPRTSAVMDRATSMQLQDGTSVTLATPGTRQWHTGIPSVDDMLIRRCEKAMIA